MASVREKPAGRAHPDLQGLGEQDQDPEARQREAGVRAVGLGRPTGMGTSPRRTVSERRGAKRPEAHTVRRMDDHAECHGFRGNLVSSIRVFVATSNTWGGRLPES